MKLEKSSSGLYRRIRKKTRDIKRRSYRFLVGKNKLIIMLKGTKMGSASNGEEAVEIGSLILSSDLNKEMRVFHLILYIHEHENQLGRL